jgi:cell division protein FtsB
VPQPPQVRRSSLTSRAAVLALVLCSLVLMLAYPVQQYLAQRGVISKLHRANAEAQQQVDVLAGQEALWKDPAFVARQARERLHYVMPGETEYVLTGGIPASASPAPTVPAAAAASGTWYDKLWGTVQSADHPVAPRTSPPALPAPTLTSSPAPITVPSASSRP